MHKMSKLLRILLLPFMLYAEGEDGGGGSSSDDTGGDNSPVDWGALNENVDPGADDDGEESSEDSASTAAPATSTGENADQKAAQKSTTEEIQSEETPAEQKTDPLTPEETSEATLTPEQIAEQEKELATKFDQWKQAESTRLASEVYKLDDDMASRLQTEPELVLPQIAAQLHLQVMQSTMEAVQRMLPNVLPQFQKQTKAEETAMDKFYGINPDLKKYHNQVLQAGKMFRKLNPKAGPDEAAKKIGDMVRSALGLEALKAEGTGKPASAAKPSGKPSPHRPAQPGSGSGVRTDKKADKSLWDEMASDDD